MNVFRELVFGLVALLAVTGQPTPRQDEFARYVAPPPVETNEVRYHYKYGIDDAVSGVFTHKWEERLGSYVKGAYSLVEPDGRVRIVDYEVDGPKGFHAVIRTSLPGNSYLSFQQLSKSRQSHKNPPVNILTNNPVKPSAIEIKPPKKVIAKDLPPNFHSVKPDYFWGDLPHDHFAHAHSEQNRHSTNVHDHHRQYPNEHSGHHSSSTDSGRLSNEVRAPSSNRPGGNTNVHDHNRQYPNGQYVTSSSTDSGRYSNEVRAPTTNRPGGYTRTWRDAAHSLPRDYMTPPKQDAQIMNYDPLKPGRITDVIYTG